MRGPQKWIPKTKEQEVKISDCKLKIVGQVMHDRLFYQTKEGDEGYTDICSTGDRILIYTVVDEKINVGVCKGCRYSRGVES